MTVQPRLAAFLDKAGTQEMPSVLALIGEEGCGKHSFCNCLATKLALPVEDVSEQISDQLVEQMYDSPIRKLYLVSVCDVVEKW